MDKDIAEDLNTHLEMHNQKLDAIAARFTETMSDEERKPFFEKISHIMALSFDLLKQIGKEHPTLNSFEGHSRQ